MKFFGCIMQIINKWFNLYASKVCGNVSNNKYMLKPIHNKSFLAEMYLYSVENIENMCSKLIIIIDNNIVMV